jgi:hypothetical protein
MYAKEVIQMALGAADRIVLGAIDKMSEHPTAFPTPNGGCHPLWVVGHLALIESVMPAILFGERPGLEGWMGMFGEQSEAVSDASAYPPFAEVKAKYYELRERNLKLLDSLSEEDLDRPTKNPPKGREREFATFGRSFLTLAIHQLAHRGQVTDAARAVGVGVPVGVGAAR